MRKSVIIAGVGGQGTLLASKIISEAACARGLFVRTSETIGMAQRGGSVSSHIRIDAKDASPVVPSGHADIILGFELAEAARQIPRLAAGASGVVNMDCIVPTNVALRQGVYLCDEYLSILRERLPGGIFINGAPIALEAGDARTLNMVILGAGIGSGVLPFTEDEVRRVMRRCIRGGMLSVNERALELGMEAAARECR
jgi:indolepyruvate ferredoxin oxidoreductase beta subunit